MNETQIQTEMPEIVVTKTFSLEPLAVSNGAFIKIISSTANKHISADTVDEHIQNGLKVVASLVKSS